MLALVFVVSLFFERICVATGRIYGYHHYFSELGLKFLGLVPYLIPEAKVYASGLKSDCTFTAQLLNSNYPTG